MTFKHSITKIFGRSQLTNILQTAWTVKTFPYVWKSGVTVLQYKKADAGNPENFPPITLQPVLSKEFTSIIRNRLFNFTSENKYIKTNLQKGFWEKISGSIKHIKCLLHIINNTRLKKRGCVVTLLDLKNAFGEVNHNLLIESLKIHQVPTTRKKLNAWDMYTKVACHQNIGFICR